MVNFVLAGRQGNKVVVFSTSPAKKAAVEALGARFINSNDANDLASVAGAYIVTPRPVFPTDRLRRRQGIRPAFIAPLLCSVTLPRLESRGGRGPAPRAREPRRSLGAGPDWRGGPTGAWREPGQLDLIIDTASANHDINIYLGALGVELILQPRRD